MNEPQKPELSIITVNFGSADKVLNLYKSITKFPPKLSWEMIIVDNPTKKGTDGEFLTKNFAGNHQVHVIKLVKNLGYGEGNNEGVKFAAGKFLAICNPDTEVLKGTFDKLLEAISREKNVGVVVPVLKTTDGKILENCRRFPSIVSLIKRRLFKKIPFVNNFSLRSSPSKILTDWAQGSFWVMKKDIYEKFAGFDSRFFLFMEDIDFCRRLKNTGLKTIQITESVAIHSPNRLSGGFIGSAIFRKTFWIHLISAVKYFWKWRNSKL